MTRIVFYSQPPFEPFEIADGVILMADEFEAATHVAQNVAWGRLETTEWRQQAGHIALITLEADGILPARSEVLADALISGHGVRRVCQRLGYLSNSVNEPPDEAEVLYLRRKRRW